MRRLDRYKEDDKQMRSTPTKTGQEIKTTKVSRGYAVTAGTGPATLDAPLGFALLRDRRICAWQKARALATGAAIMAGTLLFTALASRWIGMPGRPFSVVLDGIALAAGTLLLGALLLKRLVPREALSRVRCERYPIIPLRKRAHNGKATPRRRSDGDPLAALGYSYGDETKRYAVIPRRAR